jgi:beta-ureidopropionase
MGGADSSFGILSLQAAGWGAPASQDITANRQALADWTEHELSVSGPVDLVILPELSTTPYFCGARQDRYFHWAEPIPGPTTELFARLARRHSTTIVLPVFERAADGSYFNSAAVVGPRGELISGTIDGADVGVYRKCHVPTILNPPDTEAWEDYFFQPGQGFPVFRLPKVTMGILICYDRWFPEAWRMLAAGGAQLVAIPMVAWGFVEGPYLPMLQSRAAENGVFVASCNRSELEELDGVRMDHFGRSTIVGPDGTILAGAASGEGQRAVTATVDLAAVEKQRGLLPLLEHRRRDLYGGPPVRGDRTDQR